MSKQDTSLVNMEVKNFANFALYCGDEQFGYGDMSSLMEEAMDYASRTPGKSFDICFVDFDGDIDDDNTRPIKGEVILKYHQTFEGQIIILSGK